MKKAIHILLIILFVSSMQAGAQYISLQQMNKLASEVNRVLQVFEKYANFSPGDGSSLEVPEAYLSVFETDSRIVNFLDPYSKDRVMVTPGEFYKYIRLNYASGLSFKLNWNTDKIGKPVTADEQDVLYAAYVPVSIQAIGLFNDQKIYNVSFDCYARITFRYENEQISDIAIRYFQADKPVFRHTEEPVLSFGLYAAPAFTRIHSRDIFNDEVWDAWGEWGYRAGLNIFYTLNNHIRLYSGAGLSNFRSTYELVNFSNENINNIQKIDKDTDSYYLYVNTSLTESNTVTYLDIPLGIKYNTGGEKFRLNAQVGFDFSFLLSSPYTASGSSYHEGYYPQYNVVLHSLPDYGFTDESIDINDTWKLNAFNLSVHVVLGIELKLTDKLWLSAGPYVNAGLTDLGYDTSKHRDDYLYLSGDPGKMTTRSAGLLIEIIYKL